MKIAVAISTAKHPKSSRSISSSIDLQACAIAKQLAPTQSYIHFGEIDAGLKEYCGYGIDPIDCYTTPSAFSIHDIYTVFNNYDVILTGNKALSNFASGLFPYFLGKHLKAQVHDNIVEATCDNNRINITQYLPSGYRRLISLEKINTPYILTVHTAANYKLPYNYQSLKTGRINVNTTFASINEFDQIANWQLKKVQKMHQRISMDTQLNASERMHNSIYVTSGGNSNIHKASAKEAANSIWQMLKEKKLI